MAVRHGAFSDRLVSANATEVRDALTASCPWIVDTDRAAIDRYCRAEARAKLLHGHVVKVAAEQGIDAVPRYLWGEASRAEANAA